MIKFELSLFLSFLNFYNNRLDEKSIGMTVHSKTMILMMAIFLCIPASFAGEANANLV